MRVELTILAFCLGALSSVAAGGFYFGYSTGVGDTRAHVVLEQAARAAKPKPPVPSNRCYLKESPHANA